MNKILRVLTISGIVSALALANNQIETKNCPERKKFDYLAETTFDHQADTQDNGIYLTTDTNKEVLNNITLHSNYDTNPIASNNEDEEATDNLISQTDNNQDNTSSNIVTSNDDNNTIQSNQTKYSYDDYFACYESVKSKLAEAIECNQKYATICENCNNLTEEERKKLETNYLQLKQLIDTLEVNNDNVLRNITDKKLENEIDDEIMQILNMMEQRIVTIQNAINSINFNEQNPNFVYYTNPYHNVYGYYYRYSPTAPIQNGDNMTEDENKTDNKDNQTGEKTTLTDSQDTNENETSAENTLADINTKQRKNIDTYARLRRPSNIDTYGPQYRNIDTFFNTALIDDNMFDYNGQNYGGFGNYGMQYMCNPYMFGGKVNGYNGSNGGFYNPNLQNNNQNNNIDKNNVANSNNSNNPTNQNNKQNNIENNAVVQPHSHLKVEAETEDLEQPQKFRFGKNIDTYNQQTLQGNINTMGGKKVTEYIKDMFKKYFVKDKTDSKNTSQNDTQNNIQNNQISQSEINNYVDNFIDTNQNKNNQNNTNSFDNKATNYAINDDIKNIETNYQNDEENIEEKINKMTKTNNTNNQTEKLKESDTNDPIMPEKVDLPICY